MFKLGQVKTVYSNVKVNAPSDLDHLKSQYSNQWDSSVGSWILIFNDTTDVINDH